MLKTLIEHPNDYYSLLGLPEFKCHKKVKAMKIAAIATEELTSNDRTSSVDQLTGELRNGEVVTIAVAPDYLNKHHPEIGGYYVVYQDGYESYSPAIPFEEGYALHDT